MGNNVNQTSRVRILVVDDHEVVRSGLSQFLADASTEVVGSASDGPQAVEMATTLNPDIVLMDVRMEELDGLWALDRIKAACPQLAVVMLSSYDNPTYMARAIALGASDYLLKSASRDAIMESLRRSVHGLPRAPQSLLERIRRSMEAINHIPASMPDFALTQREIQVLRHVGLGLSNKEIAKSLCISVETVKEHVQNVLRKTKAHDRTDAAVRAVRWGLVN